MYEKLTARRAQQPVVAPPPELDELAEELRLVGLEDMDKGDSDDAFEHAKADVRAAVETVGIEEIYRRYSKGIFVNGQEHMREGRKISCPIPGHADKIPSAWINTDEDTWACGPCQAGGNKFTIVAIYMGYGPDRVKGRLAASGRPLFVELCNWIARDLRGVDFEERLAYYRQQEVAW